VAVTRNGGTMADVGSVSRIFDRKGVVEVAKVQGSRTLEEDDVLEATLESGGRSYPLGEFDVAGGTAGTPGVARGRLRAPSSAAAGTATLVLVVRQDAPGGVARAPVRLPISVR
jgi:hypothetical protein